MPKKLTTEEWIGRARAVHGSKYDYSQVVYVYADKKVKITCPEHAEFEQTPSAHVNAKQGCYKCGMDKSIKSNYERALSTGEFISRASIAHNYKYDYSQAVYKGSDKKVVIVCPVHGRFEQRAVMHLKGQGCNACGYIQAAASKTLTKAEFINRAHKVHGGKYDYSALIYENNEVNVAILCPKHGIFTQRPANHLRGSGCYRCSKSGKLNTKDFIELAKEKHGNKYNYELVDYKSAIANVDIICSRHGVFSQAAALHIKGHGCQICAGFNRWDWVSNGKGKVGVLYFLRVFSSDEEFYKVGITYNSIKARYASMLKNNHYKYEIMAVHKSDNLEAVYDWEQSIIYTFSDLAYRPKMSFVGYTECFSSCEEILSIFPL